MDVYANKIQQVAGMAGLISRGFETSMRLTFVTGYHNDISAEFQQVPVIETLTIGDLLTRARVLTRDRRFAGTPLPRSETNP